MQGFRGPVRSKVVFQDHDLGDQDSVRHAFAVNDQDAVSLGAVKARKCSCDGFVGQSDVYTVGMVAIAVFQKALQFSLNVFEARKAECPLGR